MSTQLIAAVLIVASGFFWLAGIRECSAADSRSRSVRGVVLDSDNGKPISGVWVSIPRKWAKDRKFPPEQTNERGQFSIRVPTALKDVRFHKSLYEPEVVPVGRMGRQSLDTVFMTASEPDDFTLSTGEIDLGGCACQSMSLGLHYDPADTLTLCHGSDFTADEVKKKARRTFYRHDITDQRGLRDAEVVFVKFDSVSGIPSRIENDSIHVSEISPLFDTVTLENLDDIVRCFLYQNASFLGIRPDEWRVATAIEEPFGHDIRVGRVYCRQVIRGVPVADASIRISFKSNHFESYRATFTQFENIELDVSISAEEAFSRGKLKQEQLFHEMGYPGVDLECRGAELQIYTCTVTRRSQRCAARLVWAIHCRELESPSARPTLIVDAKSGRLLEVQGGYSYCIFGNTGPDLFYTHGH